MNSGNGEQLFDEDILRCKAEILRLKGVVPPFGRPPKRDSSPPADKHKILEPVSESIPEPEIETQAASASDQLYNELQEPAIVSETEARAESPDLEADWPTKKAEITAEFDENPMAEAIIEEVAGQQPDEEEFEAKIDDSGLEEEEAELDAERESILAAIEEDEIVEAAAAEPQSEPEEDMEVPGFDLAQQIMAEQRKITGNRRKSPGSPRFEIKEEKPKPPSIALPLRKAPMATASQAPMSPQQKVIAEIVARDIRKHYQISHR